MATDVAYVSNIQLAASKHKMQVTAAPLLCSLAGSVLHSSSLVHSMSSIQYVPVTAM